MKKIISVFVLIAFILTSINTQGYAQLAHDNALNLPQPGTMVGLSSSFEPTLIKGLTVHKDNPFLFDFIVDTGNSNLQGPELKKESDRLVKYFFACLTIPEKDLWVNLSPYEKDRMIPHALGQTALGRDLLAEDYILKQLTASMIYPEKSLGKEFWNRVYAKAQAMYGTTQIPVNTFNKVWILADHADVYENGQTAFVLDGHLKVMLDEDYLSLQKHQNSAVILSATKDLNKLKDSSAAPQNDTHGIASKIIRQIVLPEIEHEVNTGKNFASLRQIYNSLILASWYRNNLKTALLNQVYADKSTVKGVNLADPSVKERIYQQYLKAYRKGVFNYIKEENDPSSTTPIPRKYFSGGFGVGNNFEKKWNSTSLNGTGAAMVTSAWHNFGRAGKVFLAAAIITLNGVSTVLADVNAPTAGTNTLSSTNFLPIASSAKEDMANVLASVTARTNTSVALIDSGNGYNRPGDIQMDVARKDFNPHNPNQHVLTFADDSNHVHWAKVDNGPWAIDHTSRTDKYRGFDFITVYEVKPQGPSKEANFTQYFLQIPPTKTSQFDENKGYQASGKNFDAFYYYEKKVGRWIFVRETKELIDNALDAFILPEHNLPPDYVQEIDLNKVPKHDADVLQEAISNSQGDQSKAMVVRMQTYMERGIHLPESIASKTYAQMGDDERQEIGAIYIVGTTAERPSIARDFKIPEALINQLTAAEKDMPVLGPIKDSSKAMLSPAELHSIGHWVAEWGPRVTFTVGMGILGYAIRKSINTFDEAKATLDAKEKVRLYGEMNDNLSFKIGPGIMLASILAFGHQQGANQVVVDGFLALLASLMRGGAVGYGPWVQKMLAKAIAYRDAKTLAEIQKKREELTDAEKFEGNPPRKAMFIAHLPVFGTFALFGILMPHSSTYMTNPWAWGASVASFLLGLYGGNRLARYEQGIESNPKQEKQRTLWNEDTVLAAAQREAEPAQEIYKRAYDALSADKKREITAYFTHLLPETPENLINEREAIREIVSTLEPTHYNWPHVSEILGKFRINQESDRYSFLEAEFFDDRLMPRQHQMFFQALLWVADGLEFPSQAMMVIPSGYVMADEFTNHLYTSNGKVLIPQPEDVEAIRKILNSHNDIDVSALHWTAMKLEDMKPLELDEVLTGGILERMSSGETITGSHRFEDKSYLQILIDLLGSNDQKFKKEFYAQAEQKPYLRAYLQEIFRRTGVTLESLTRIEKQSAGAAMTANDKVFQKLFARQKRIRNAMAISTVIVVAVTAMFTPPVRHLLRGLSPAERKAAIYSDQSVKWHEMATSLKLSHEEYAIILERAKEEASMFIIRDLIVNPSVPADIKAQASDFEQKIQNAAKGNLFIPLMLLKRTAWEHKPDGTSNLWTRIGDDNRWYEITNGVRIYAPMDFQPIDPDELVSAAEMQKYMQRYPGWPLKKEKDAQGNFVLSVRNPSGKYVSVETNPPSKAMKTPRTDVSLALPVNSARDGGIDLNTASMAMTVTKDAHGGVQINFNPALIAQIRAKGVWSAEPFIVQLIEINKAQFQPLLGFSK